MYFHDTISHCHVDTLSASGDELALRYCWRPHKTLDRHLAHLRPSDTTPIFPSATALRNLLHTLPQELYDMIYDLTFSPPLSQHIPLTPSYTPPSTLQVNRSTRHAYLKLYYGNNVFEPSDATMVWRFTNSLGKEVREVVRRQVERSWEETVRGRWKGRWPPDPAFAFAWDFA